MFEAHKSDPIATRIVHREKGKTGQKIKADICVLGAGITGISAALEAAKLGRRVVLADAAPTLGGQAIGSVIGTIIGLYTHGPDPYQITHGIADELIKELTAEGSLLRYHRTTVNFQFDQVRLGRWMDRKVEEAGIEVLVGAVLTNVSFENRRAQEVDFATRYGQVTVEANGYVDASGDANLTYEAGLDVREPEEPVYGSMNFQIEGYNRETVKDLVMQEVYDCLKERGSVYGLVRHDGFLMHFPEKDFMLANITHFETSLDPLKSANLVFEGRRQVDSLINSGGKTRTFRKNQGE